MKEGTLKHKQQEVTKRKLPVFDILLLCQNCDSGDGKGYVLDLNEQRVMRHIPPEPFDITRGAREEKCNHDLSWQVLHAQQ